ncbi:MAG TPA: DUF898 family protein [Candidatus Cybelea sp.]|nr:DUF898 family protein [Candidatus Cybelea sp.]
MDAKVEGAAAAAPQVEHVAYQPARSLALLLLKNYALTLVTLGIYRFWAKTAVRRYFWSSIRIADEPLEYTGRGIELFIGFLIVLAVLIVFAVLNSAIKFLAQTDPISAAVLQVVYLIVLIVLVQVAMFRARRYRLSRTRWRGIRCGQDGSTWRYLGIFLLYSLLGIVTLGISTPWARVALERYKMVHTRFGDRYFAFEASGLKLLPKWLVLYLPIVLATALIVWLNLDNFLLMQKLSGDPDAMRKHPEAAKAALAFLWIYLPFAFGIFGYVWYRLAEFRYFVDCSRLGEIGFKSTASGGVVNLIIVANIFGAFFVLIAFGILIAIVAGIFAVATGAGGAGAPPTPPAAPVAAIIVGVLVFFLIVYPLFGILSYLTLRVPILKHLCRRFTFRNLGAADQIVQSSAPSPKFGEGLADSFDFGF